MANNHRTFKNVTKGVVNRICVFFAQHLFPVQLRIPKRGYDFFFTRIY